MTENNFTDEDEEFLKAINDLPEDKKNIVVGYMKNKIDNYKEETKKIIENATENYSCNCQGGECPCCAVMTFKNKVLNNLKKK
jgi:hypothetical protein